MSSNSMNIQNAIDKETQRQEAHIELIASENYVSPAVLAAQGSVLTNKYAEGYPGRRYYGGCEHVDVVEQIAIDRAKQLFSAEYANVQPHSGSQANAAAYMALLQPGDTVLGMDLSEGGHLTHGSAVNFSGKLYRFVHYGLNEATGDIDYEAVEKLAVEHQPKLIVTGFSAFSGLVDWQRFRQIADQVGAFLLADMAHVAGLVAAGKYPSPLPFADIVTSTTHKTLRGPRGGLILARKAVGDQGAGLGFDFAKRLNSAVFPGLQGGPLMHVIAAKAVAFEEALQPDFQQYQQRVLDNANAMVAVIKQRSFKVVSGGTKNHLFMIDLMNKGLTGKDAENRLGEANITLNKNMVPNDQQSPFITSGLRLGTPAITTRGFGGQEAEQIAHWICDILDDISCDAVLARVKNHVANLCERFPVYDSHQH